MRNPFKSSWVVLAALLITVGFSFAQRIPKPSGLNMFSKEQELQLGQEAAAEVEKKAKLITQRDVVAYIEGIGKRLARAPESGGYPYTFKVVLDDSINAFALPGGPTFV